MFPQQVDRALRKRVALLAPTLPSDIGMHIIGLEADRFQNANCLGQHLVANSISRHSNDCGSSHASSPAAVIEPRRNWLLPRRSGVQSESLCYQVLDSTGDDQRLRYTAERREAERLLRILQGAGCEVDFDFITGDDRLFAIGHRLRIARLHLADELRRLDAQKAVIKSIA